jgi:hypothetical protein
VDADAAGSREYDHVRLKRSNPKKREELTAALTALATEEKSTREQIDKQFEVAEKVDGIRAEIDAPARQPRTITKTAGRDSKNSGAPNRHHGGNSARLDQGRAPAVNQVHGQGAR